MGLHPKQRFSHFKTHTIPRNICSMRPVFWKENALESDGTFVICAYLQIQYMSSPREQASTHTDTSCIIYLLKLTASICSSSSPLPLNQLQKCSPFSLLYWLVSNCQLFSLQISPQQVGCAKVNRHQPSIFIKESYSSH